MNIKKYLIVTFIFVLMFTIIVTSVSAVDESGSVVVDTDYFSCRAMDVYDYGMSYLFTKNTSSTSTGIYTKEIYDNSFNYNGIYTFYPIFYPNSSLSSVEDFKYLTISVDIAVVSPYVLIESNSLLFVSNDSSYTVNVGDDFYGVVINYNSIDRYAVNIHYIVDISSLPFDVEDIQTIVPIFTIRTTVSESLPFLFSDLKIDYFKNYQDVIVDVNSNVQEVINQNNIIINNLGDVNDKLDEFINTDIDESKKEEFEDEISKDIEDMESIFDREESLGNNANDKLNVSIDYDTSYTNQALKDVLDSNIFSNFFNYLFDYPFVVIAFTLLPFLWLSYILLYRG